MVSRIPITKARINLGQLARRVHVNKEYFILEKDGIPVAGLMDADELEDYLEMQDPKVQEHIRASQADYLAGRVESARKFMTRFEKSRRSKRSRRRA
jgi:PHD/YefM family antitoxin component YafN of YafNO toxin-antitoxin module